jgi:hypothetical protein
MGFPGIGATFWKVLAEGIKASDVAPSLVCWKLVVNLTALKLSESKVASLVGQVARLFVVLVV